MSMHSFPKKFRTKKGLWEAYPDWVVIGLFTSERNARILEGTTHPGYLAGQLRSGFDCINTNIWEPCFDPKNIKYNLKDKKCVK